MNISRITFPVLALIIPAFLSPRTNAQNPSLSAPTIQDGGSIIRDESAGRENEVNPDPVPSVVPPSDPALSDAAPSASTPARATAPVATLDTTTVQSKPPVSNQKVTPDRYYSMLQTTGSYRVNTDRAQADFDAALQEAKRVKRIKEEAASVRHYQVPGDFASASQMLEEMPPPQNGPPLTSNTPPIYPPTAPPEAPAGQNGPPQPPGEIEYVDMREGGYLVKRFRETRNRSRTSLTPSPEGPAAEGPDLQEVPEFEGADQAIDGNMAPEEADRPVERSNRGFFARLFGNSSSTQTMPEAGSQPPAPRSIFRPDVTVRKANAFSVVVGDEVYAMVNGEPVKISAGTRVKVLRTGTERSLVRLYDNRQASIPNGALAPE